MLYDDFGIEYENDWFYEELEASGLSEDEIGELWDGWDS